ncbi:TIGR03757 family integrating conjugative element protein [Pseudomonas fragi]|uniref:TIGR03757 family integrating conjugative element protein n=1 Tax=Pseudomonas fragi TaxID=296 RepID=UPI0016BAFFD5|nr:TIGR03757 family integrating conjugative element protein [Pseudomonas fragi]NNB02957.1 TIGR03757 family integrating conjugative element protein [Pseudomonas fragi]
MRCRLLPLSLVLLPVTVPADALVVTDKTHPVTAVVGTRIVLLDQQHHLETELSRALPSDPQQAAAIIQNRLNSPSGKRLQSDLAKAQQALTDAWSMGIEKIPAVVVDRRYVVYGEPDVTKALDLINRARSQPQ